MGKIRAITILLMAMSSPAWAGLSNPAELVEESQLSPKDVGQRYKPAIDAKEVEELTTQLPVYRTEDKGASRQEIERAKSDYNSKKPVEVKDPGRKGSSQIQRGVAGVPQYDFYDKKEVKEKDGKVRVVKIPKEKVPRLDIGKEARISKSDFLLPQFKFSMAQEKNAKALPSPALVQSSHIQKITGQKLAKVGRAKDVQNLKTVKIKKPVTEEVVRKTQPVLNVVKDTKEKPVKELSKDEMKMLTALILYRKKDRCPTIMGLFYELAEKKQYKDEANYYLGACAADLKLYSEAYARLVPFVEQESKEYGSDAIRLLLSGFEGEYEDRLSTVLSKLKNQSLIPEKVKHKANMVMARGAYQRNKFSQARQYANKVPAGDTLYPQAQYLLGLVYYSEKNETKAQDVWEGLRQYMAEKQVGDKNLNSLTAINLARLKFNRGDYEAAQDYYMKINKDHPSWVRGLVEQGWSQIMQDDFAGAIGNMYSLHSPYFKTVYKPESFVVRTIGYINICQYGDAYRTLSWLEKEYRPWMDKVSQYMSEKKKDPLAYYATMKTYLQGKSTDDIEGLPYQVIREMGRRKDFLNDQAALNQKVDEVERYAKTGTEIIEHRRKIRWRKKEAQQRFEKVKADLAKAKKDKSLIKNVSQWEAQYRKERDLIVGYHFELLMLEEGRQGYRDFVKRAENRIEDEKLRLKKSAGNHLIAHMSDMKQEMAKFLDNNEFLRYEVFAGSGENIRYQVAGGDTAQPRRIPASVKPEKIMNWNFDGEFWEDEIGNYRSSLQNNCPNMAGPQQGKSEKNDQASLSRGVGL